MHIFEYKHPDSGSVRHMVVDSLKAFRETFSELYPGIDVSTPTAQEKLDPVSSGQFLDSVRLVAIDLGPIQSEARNIVLCAKLLIIDAYLKGLKRQRPPAPEGKSSALVRNLLEPGLGHTDSGHCQQCGAPASDGMKDQLC